MKRPAKVLATVRRQGGRLFICGSGGGAGHASHAVNNFRKLAGIESYCPSDNVSELTARINDEGRENSYADWLVARRISKNNGLLVFSVGGGCRLRKASMNLVHAMMSKRKAIVSAITGRDGGEAKKLANVLILVPTVNSIRITPNTDSFQAINWHLIASHQRWPKIKQNGKKI